MKLLTVTTSALLALAAAASCAQAPASSSQLPDAPVAQRPTSDSRLPLEDEPHIRPTLPLLPVLLLSDGVHIIAAPAYIRTSDLKWLLPLAGASAAAFATDTTTVNDVVSHDPGFNNAAVNTSDVLVGSLVAVPAALFAAGHLTGNEHARESGFLGGEAMIDAAVAGEVVKLVGFRERPTVDKGQGEFFTYNSGVDSSFVSEHSIVAWSSAAALAGEYPTWWKQVGIYTLATGVSVTRVLGEQHFPSDVLIGSAAGWLIGHYVFRAHHHWSQTH